MIVQYGSINFAAGAAEWRTRTRTRSNDAGVPVEQTSEVEVVAQLQGTDPVNIAAQTGVVRRVLSGWGNDLVLRFDAGGIAEYLTNAGSLGGTRVVEGPDFFDGRGADFTTYRNVRFMVQATYPMPGLQNVVEFEERFVFQGGGAEYTFLQPKKGPPIKVQQAEQTPYIVTQTGSAVGLIRYPTPPQPRWATAMLRAPEVVESRPNITTGVLRNYRVEWTYVFGSAGPLR